MARLYGELPAGNATTLVFLSDGLTVDRQHPAVKVGMMFGLIGGLLTASARGQHRDRRQQAEAEFGRDGCAAVADALERGSAIPWSDVDSVTLAAYGKWGYHVLTIAKKDGTQEWFKYLDRQSTRLEELRSWMAKAPEFKVGPPLVNRAAVAKATSQVAPPRFD